MADYGILRPLPPVQVPDIAGEFQKGMETGRQNAARRLLVPAMKGDQDAMDKLGDLSPDAYMKISEWRRSASDQQRKQAQAGAQYMDKVAAGADQMSDQELPQFYAAAVAGAQQMGMDVSGIPQLSDPGQIRNYIKMTHLAFKKAIDPGKVVSPGGTMLDEDGKPIFTAPYTVSPSEAETMRHNRVTEGIQTRMAGAGFSDEDLDYAAAQYVKTGQMPSMGRNVAGRMAILSRARELQQSMDSGEPLSESAQAGFNSLGQRVDYGVGKKAAEAFGTGKQGDSVRSANVAVLHLDQLKGLSNALANGDIQKWNWLVNKGREEFGDPDITNFEGVKEMAMDEVAKFVVGGNFTQGDREALKSSISKASSPAQLAGLIDNMQGLMAGQMTGYRKQYESATGRRDFETKLLPGTMDVMKRHGYGAETAGPPNAFAPAPSGFEEGRIYQDANGNKARYQNGQWTPVQ